jgi:hypothetical protein
VPNSLPAPRGLVLESRVRWDLCGFEVQVDGVSRLVSIVEGILKPLLLAGFDERKRLAYQKLPRSRSALAPPLLIIERQKAPPRARRGSALRALRPGPGSRRYWCQLQRSHSTAHGRGNQGGLHEVHSSARQVPGLRCGATRFAQDDSACVSFFRSATRLGSSARRRRLARTR